MNFHYLGEGKKNGQVVMALKFKTKVSLNDLMASRKNLLDFIITNPSKLMP
jgi:hypothetical protein